MTKRKKWESPIWLKNLSSYFSQYCGSTSIHGIQYIGEHGRFLIEKLIWIIIITTVCYFCLHLIMKSYHKWVTSPVIVTFATTETPIHKIPFPAVTICPEVKTNPYLFNYTKAAINYHKNAFMSDEELIYFEKMSLLCDGLAETFSFRNPKKYSNEHPVILLSHLFPNLKDDKLSKVQWFKESNINELLSETITSEGFCYSFNMLNDEDLLNDHWIKLLNGSSIKPRMNLWTLENGYLNTNKFGKVYPRRTFMSGIDGGLLVILYTNHNYLDYTCGLNPEGFKVTVHLPSDLPNMEQSFHLSLDSSVQIGVNPRMITISEQLKSYKPEDRKCYLATERDLKYFRFYSQENCLSECFINHTLKHCNCIPFYMPFQGNESMCDLGSLKCIAESKVNFLNDEQLNDKDENRGEHKVCNCLPSCTFLEYDIETSQTPWNWKQIFKTYYQINRTLGENLVFDEMHLSKFVIYYKEMQFLTTERNELYGYVDFFSSVGGLMGLWIGISVTSIIEILYFLTLRLICNIQMYGKRFWSGDEKLIEEYQEQENNDL